MSEARVHFKIKQGETEIEFEGPLKDANERYDDAFEWVRSIPIKTENERKAQKEEGDAGEKKKGTRGPEIWSPAIDGLIQEGYFKLPNKRDNKAVMKTLEDKGLPVKGKAKIILQTLIRKVRKGDLKGTHGPEGWTFWIE